MDITNYLSSKLANHSLGLVAFTMPSGLWVALYTVAPTASSAGTEVGAGLGYSRQVPLFQASADGSGNAAATITDLDFGPATSAWGTINAVGILDAASSGNLLFFKAVTPQPVAAAQPFQVLAGKLSLQFG